MLSVNAKKVRIGDILLEHEVLGVRTILTPMRVNNIVVSLNNDTRNNFSLGILFIGSDFNRVTYLVKRRSLRKDLNEGDCFKYAVDSAWKYIVSKDYPTDLPIKDDWGYSSSEFLIKEYLDREVYQINSYRTEASINVEGFITPISDKQTLVDQTLTNKVKISLVNQALANIMVDNKSYDLPVKPVVKLANQNDYKVWSEELKRKVKEADTNNRQMVLVQREFEDWE